ncbi:MAG: MarR family transcriptional regulator [Sphingomonas bacterium]|uniref:GNAT family N-acetyltransferase n=1 Tax=Sphingomonas bacterium TaxID=1895847 RepID=UPI0026277D03|nr:GNAT family N-acetyltransferase [Sphingomonas bacterium]MDB5695724.1 MarR family transcriptional regulator [Sphingomonas bacterium]
MVTIRDFTGADAIAFHAINAAWIGSLFRLEPHDEAVLGNPQANILDRGGVILMAELPDQGVVGTGALMPDGRGGVELTKMGVTDAAQGRGVGRALLTALIERSTSLHAAPLYLLTNRRCAAAIHLYEQAGFQHDADVMAARGAVYARCDVAMRWRLQTAG